MMLARLLASMKDDDGRVLVDHFYDGIEPLSETEKRAIAAAPAVEADLMKELWLGHVDGGGKSLLELTICLHSTSAAWQVRAWATKPAM